MSSQFQQKYNGRFYNTLHWEQLDKLWGVLKENNSDWYVYFINHEEVPLAPLETNEFQIFLEDSFLPKGTCYTYPQLFFLS